MAAKPFHYTMCGLDNVFLLSGFRIRTTAYGKVFSIDDIDGLHAAIGNYLVNERKSLSGKEVRFLRHEMDLSQSRLGRLLGVDEQTVARWEKGQANASGPADKMIRLLYTEWVGATAEVSRLLDHLAELDETETHRALFKETGKGWRAA
jgi:DNA-binding transcriptional regulator YiaG